MYVPRIYRPLSPSLSQKLTSADDNTALWAVGRRMSSFHKSQVEVAEAIAWNSRFASCSITLRDCVKHFQCQ